MLVLFVHSLDTRDSVGVDYISLNSVTFSHFVDATAYSNARFGQGSDPIFVDNTACTGSESRLLDCGYDMNTNDCTHAEDAGLRCSGRCKFFHVT